jgi:hypothetical protein
MARIAELRRLIEAARSIADDRSSFLDAIVESTGLSPAGVELAFTKHLETDATDDDLSKLAAHAREASRIAVILSSNVFVGALRAIALARAASDRVIVRPSRRDPTFARALVERVADPAIALDESFDIESLDEGEIHVYGHDETIADIRTRAKVPVRGHGSGMGVAWISNGGADERARALAEDVVVFDQRGCLSPRIVLVHGDTDAFAEALHAELEKLDVTIPRGDLPADVRAASDRYIATMTYACRALVGTGHVIGIAPIGAPLVATPAYRHVHVAACANEEEAAALLAPLRNAIVAVGTNGDATKIAPPWARVSRLGRMQRPPLDGPVDRRPEWADSV